MEPAVSSLLLDERKRDHMNIGELIKALDACHPTAIVSIVSPLPCVPALEFCSYRGYYDRLCIMPVEGHDGPTAGALSAALREAMGQVFVGWKGGEYVYHADTLVHCAREGSTGPEVVGVTSEYDYLVG